MDKDLMASTGPWKLPSIEFYSSDDITNLHVYTVPEVKKECKMSIMVEFALV